MSVGNEVPFFFGESERLLGVLHQPRSRNCTGGGWVICPPFGRERTNAHRLLFEWARVLAREGLWALRFDYRGTGDSRGAFADLSLDDHLADVGTAVETMEGMFGVPCRGLMGLRLGATLAVMAAVRADLKTELMLWEPIVDGRVYADQLLRTAMANELSHSHGSPRSRVKLKEDLASGKDVLVDGFTLTAKMHDALASVDLAKLGRPGPARTLLVQIDVKPNRPVRQSFETLRRLYSENGDAVLETACAPPAWLRVKSWDWRPADLFGKSLRWIREGLLHENSRPASGSCRRDADSSAGVGLSRARGAASARGAEERPVGFQVGHDRVWGILHMPAGRLPKRPNVVLLPAGDACRSVGFYVKVARELARLGWPTLRFDARGIGDGHGEINGLTVAEVHLKIQKGLFLPDTIAAMDFLERELGEGRSILTGLCGGAITAVFAAAEDDRVIGIAPIDLRMHYTRLPRAPLGKTTEHLSWGDLASSSRVAPVLLTARRTLHSLRGRATRLLPRLASALEVWRSGKPGDDGWQSRHLGAHVNAAMLAALEGVLKRRIPVFCIFADTQEPRHFETIRPHLVRGGEGLEDMLQVHVVEGADHNLTVPGSADRLIAVLTSWLSDRDQTPDRACLRRVSVRAREGYATSTAQGSRRSATGTEGPQRLASRSSGGPMPNASEGHRNRRRPGLCC
jgi:alpha/beta superfamily hydrolase